MPEVSHLKNLSSLVGEKLRGGDYEGAIEAFRKSIAIKEDWSSYQGLGWLLLKTNKSQEAIDTFGKSIKLKEDWNSYRGLGSALFNTNQFEAAREAFGKSLCLKEDWSSYQGLGGALINTHQFPEAIEAFRKSLALKSDWSSYQGLGWALFNTDAYGEAIDAFSKALSRKEDWNSYQGLGWSLIHSKQFLGALEAFRKSIVLKEDWYTYQGLATVLFNTKHFVEAGEAFSKSIELKEDWNSYHGLGSALLIRRHFPEAIHIFRKSIELKEDWNSYHGLGSALFQLEKYSESIDAFEKSLALNKSWNSYHGLGSALFQLEKYKDALDAFRKSIDLKEDWNSYFSLGNLFIKVKRELDALEVFSRSWTMNKDRRLLKIIPQAFLKSYPEYYNIFSAWLKLRKNKFLVKKEIDLINHSKNYLALMHGAISSGYVNPLLFRCYSVCSYTPLWPITVNKLDEVMNPNTSNQIKKLPQLLEVENIISFGDSHGKIFLNHRSIKHISLRTGTAYNINNPNSSSGSHKHIIDTLKEYKPENTAVILTLGEVDIRVHVHRQSRMQNRIPELIIIDIVKNYTQFIERLNSIGYMVLLNLPHTGGGQSQSSVSEEERNDICSYLNELLIQECSKRRVKYASLYKIVVDPITRKNKNIFFYDPHHVHLPTSPIGKSLQSILLNQFLHKSELVRKSSSSKIDINVICRILATNIPGWINLESLYSNNFIAASKVINDSEKYFALLELPFPILPSKITLQFESLYKNVAISSNCYSIYECCNPFDLPEQNVYEGRPVVDEKDIGQKIKIEHDFSEHTFTNMHARYIFISILNAEGIRFTKIGISRMRHVELN